MSDITLRCVKVWRTCCFCCQFCEIVTGATFIRFHGRGANRFERAQDEFLGVPLGAGGYVHLWVVINHNGHCHSNPLCGSISQMDRYDHEWPSVESEFHEQLADEFQRKYTTLGSLRLFWVPKSSWFLKIDIKMFVMFHKVTTTCMLLVGK